EVCSMRHLGSNIGAASIAAGGLLCASLMSCSDGPSDPVATALVAPAGAREGTLVRYVATYADGHSETWYSLRDENGSTRLRLAFEKAANAQTGSRVRVWGDLVDERLHVSGYQELEKAPALGETPALRPEATKQDTYAFVLVDTGGGLAITAAQAQTSFF